MSDSFCSLEAIISLRLQGSLDEFVAGFKTKPLSSSPTSFCVFTWQVCQVCVCVCGGVRWRAEVGHHLTNRKKIVIINYFSSNSK